MKQGIAFSGGKDSWALLWLFEEQLPSLPVIWVNTGKNYPETLAMVEKAREICPRFIEVHSDQEEHIRRFGIPADVVPVNWTNLGQSMTTEKATKIQPWISCCYGNISVPLTMKARELSLTHLISGQRVDEKCRASYSSGASADGLVHLFPLLNWTREDVMKFLETKMEIPAHFSMEHSSLDCYDCTAFSHESKDRLAFTKEKYPAFFAEYRKKRAKLDSAISEALSG